MPEQNPISTETQILDDTNERDERMADARKLVHDLVGGHTEYFANPNNRLEFIRSLNAETYLKIAKYVNAKLRGEKPHLLRQDPNEKGGYLPGLHTPNTADKPEAFMQGFAAIQDYLASTNDSIEKQLEGVAMATEALIIWVHPFNDGNGRTSRFMAKLIEDGAADIDSLVNETAERKNRNMYYKSRVMTKEGQLALIDNEDVFGAYDDKDPDELRKRAEKYPTDIEAMHSRIKGLLENDEVRLESAKFRPHFDKAA